MTDDDKPIEYEETTETFKDGTTRTTKTPKIPDSKDSQDPKPPEGEPAQNIIHKVAAAAASPNSAKRYAKSSTPQSSKEEPEDSPK